MTPAIHHAHDNITEGVLFVAFALNEKTDGEKE